MQPGFNRHPHSAGIEDVHQRGMPDGKAFDNMATEGNDQSDTLDERTLEKSTPERSTLGESTPGNRTLEKNSLGESTSGDSTLG